MRCSSLLVAHDLTPHADLLLAALARRGITADRVHVVHVLPDRRAGGGLRQGDEDRCAEALGRLRASLCGTPWAGAHLHVAVGDPGTRIVALAADLDCDVIALGTHGQRGRSRLEVGSVAEHVVRFATCLAIVVPDRAIGAELTTTPEVLAIPCLEDQVEAVGLEVCRRVGEDPGRLTAVTVGLPTGADVACFEGKLVAWLAAAGVEFVDLAFVPVVAGDAPHVLRTRFERSTDRP